MKTIVNKALRFHLPKLTDEQILIIGLFSILFWFLVYVAMLIVVLSRFMDHRPLEPTDGVGGIIIYKAERKVRVKLVKKYNQIIGKK